MYGSEGAVPKESFGKYKEQLTGSYNPFGKTGQGVYLSGEVKWFKPDSHSESEMSVTQVWDVV